MKTLQNSTPNTALPCDDLPEPPAAAGPSLAADPAPTSDSGRESVLRALRLSDADLAVLKRQGSVHRERRGQQTIRKLRFRRDGQQVVRYLGSAEATRQVKKALMEWQTPHRQSRALLRLARNAREALRSAKQTLAPHLERNGYHFHGLAIRQRRAAPAGDALEMMETHPILVNPNLFETFEEVHP